MRESGLRTSICSSTESPTRDNGLRTYDVSFIMGQLIF